LRTTHEFELRSGHLLAMVTLWTLVCVACGGGGKRSASKPKECSDCYPEGFRIDPTPAPVGTNPPPAVLFSGWRNGWCREDLICTGTPEVFLGKVGGLPFGRDCKQEVVAFAGGHEPTTADIDPSLSGLTVTLKPERTLDFTVWIVEHVLSSADVKLETDIAASVYTNLGTGIQLNPTIKLFPSPLPSNLTDLKNDASCDLAAALGKLSGATGNDPGRLNVYYVDGFSITAGPAAGLNCFPPPYARPDIIFVDGSLSSSPYVLAHELGHALGLQRSAPLPSGGGSVPYGHVNELYLDPYLRTDNLMQSGATIVRQITVGEIYRMHFDELSWLWHGKTPAAGYPRECQNSPVTGGKCPPLTIQPPGGWP
jgi:hypothetical protein